MKTERNILIAFLLNFFFSIFEFIGGTFSNSISIISDSIHDMGDALSIGISYILEKISKKKPNDSYTYGYVRYSTLGSVITTVILITGSLLVIYKGIYRMFNPVSINYHGMIIFAIVGIIVNFSAAYFTSHGDSLNQKTVNLHMLEDVLGWVVVLIGAIIMNFTDITIIDSILSILVALFILFNAFSNLKEILNLFLIKKPDDILMSDIRDSLLKIDGVKDIHHVHIWSIDGYNNFLTMHVVCDGEFYCIKKKIKKELSKFKITHSTIELENVDEKCDDLECCLDDCSNCSHHHHHHHHH